MKNMSNSVKPATRIIDSDGHVRETDNEIIEYMSAGYRARRRRKSFTTTRGGFMRREKIKLTTEKTQHEGTPSARVCTKRSNRSIRSSCSTNPFRSDGFNDLNGLNYLNRLRAAF